MIIPVIPALKMVFTNKQSCLPLSVVTSIEPRNRTTKLSTNVALSMAESRVSSTSLEDWSNGLIRLLATNRICMQ